jgi:hypothetical protein
LKIQIAFGKTKILLVGIAKKIEFLCDLTLFIVCCKTPQFAQLETSKMFVSLCLVGAFFG